MSLKTNNEVLTKSIISIISCFKTTSIKVSLVSCATKKVGFWVKTIARCQNETQVIIHINIR